MICKQISKIIASWTVQNHNYIDQKVWFKQSPAGLQGMFLWSFSSWTPPSASPAPASWTAAGWRGLRRGGISSIKYQTSNMAHISNKYSEATRFTKYCNFPNIPSIFVPEHLKYRYVLPLWMAARGRRGWSSHKLAKLRRCNGSWSIFIVWQNWPKCWTITYYLIWYL